MIRLTRLKIIFYLGIGGKGIDINHCQHKNRRETPYPVQKVFKSGLEGFVTQKNKSASYIFAVIIVKYCKPNSKITDTTSGP